MRLLQVQSRTLFLLAATGCAALMGFSLYLQHSMGLEPCPLCISQRIAMTALGVMLLITAIHNPGVTGYRVYGALTTFLGLVGAALAARQLWVQSLSPEEMLECKPPIEFLIDILPFTEIVQMMLTGTGDCGEVQWVFLGLSIPGWTLVMFSGFTLFGLFELCRKKD
ncbi:MAG: disulfide bond formation protein B [Endozoicomonas sp.]